MTTPIFIISTGRSGSTLLQKIIASHESVGTTPEPHLLLPMIYAFKKEGVFAQYHQTYAVKGLTEFCDLLPGKQQDYFDELRKMAIDLYREAGQGNPFFLDKTPAYAFVAKELVEIFPKAKFIFLVRNPVAVIASALQLYGQGKWRLFPVHDNLVLGMKNVFQAVEKHGEQSCVVRFEDLINKPKAELQRISNYLGITFEPDMISSFATINFEGKMGDPNAKKYKKISSEPLEKWKMVLNTPLRKKWIKNFLRFLGHERLISLGYDPGPILKDLATLPNAPRKAVQDLFEMGRDVVKLKIKYYIFKKTANYL